MFRSLVLALVVVSMAFAALPASPQPALAAVDVGAGSCGGGPTFPNCANILTLTNVTIGTNSCTALGSCDDLGEGTVTR